MRKTPYLVSLGVLLVTVVLTVLSIAMPDWLYADAPPNLPPGTHVRYGLYQRCESGPSKLPFDPTPDPHPIPGPLPPVPTASSPLPSLPDHTSSLLGYSVNSKRVTYRCRPWPLRSSCEAFGERFCVLWASAGYISQISVVFGLAGLIILLIVSSQLSTRARRRGAWKLVSGAVAVHGALQIATMAIVAHLFITAQDRFSDPDTRLYVSFYLCVTSIILSILLTVGLIYTGVAARAGHRWAAGRRPYEAIPDGPSTSSQLPT